MPFGWDHDTIRNIFIGTWLVLFVGSLIFQQVASPALKIKTHIPFAVLVGVLFLGFVTLLDGGKSFWFLAVAVTVVTALNIISVRYCPECGAMVYRPFARPEFCAKCGAPLDGSPRRDPGSHDLRRR